MYKVQWYLQPLDRRFTSAEYFNYRIEACNGVTSDKILEFNRMRQWFTDTFGPAMERDLNRYLPQTERKTWAWHVDVNKGTFLLYLSSSKELALWKLKWT